MGPPAMEVVGPAWERSAGVAADRVPEARCRMPECPTYQAITSTRQRWTLDRPIRALISRAIPDRVRWRTALPAAPASTVSREAASTVSAANRPARGSVRAVLNRICSASASRSGVRRAGRCARVARDRGPAPPSATAAIRSPASIPGRKSSAWRQAAPRALPRWPLLATARARAPS